MAVDNDFYIVVDEKVCAIIFDVTKRGYLLS